MRNIALRPRALGDLDDIFDYTDEKWGRAQAVDYLEGIGATLKLLAEYPEMARLRKEISPPVRIHVHRAHVIIYLADDRTLDVLRIVHARADWAAFLAE